MPPGSIWAGGGSPLEYENGRVLPSDGLSRVATLQQGMSLIDWLGLNPPHLSPQELVAAIEF